MGTDHENLLKDTIGGTFSNELIANADSSPDDQSAESGAKYSERPEPFYYVSVDIKEHRSLPEALDKFISGETVDFAWESKDEDGNVSKINLPTTKQISIKTLPQHLLIHLKRFEFDFETLQQVKINSRFEFPENLDMFAYTKEGRQAGQGRAPMEESRERADDDDEEISAIFEELSRSGDEASIETIARRHSESPRARRRATAPLLSLLFTSCGRVEADE